MACKGACCASSNSARGRKVVRRIHGLKFGMVRAVNTLKLLTLETPFKREERGREGKKNEKTEKKEKIEKR